MLLCTASATIASPMYLFTSRSRPAPRDEAPFILPTYLPTYLTSSDHARSHRPIESEATPPLP